jgi:hypothetical protein
MFFDFRSILLFKGAASPESATSRDDLLAAVETPPFVV